MTSVLLLCPRIELHGCYALGEDECISRNFYGRIHDILYCLSRLERITARVYRKIAGRSKDLYAKLVLDFIGNDSGKHSIILREMAEAFKEKEKGSMRIMCSALLGSFYRDTCRMLRDVERVVESKESIDRDTMLDILEKLTGFEGMVGEEYLAGLVTRLLASSGSSLEEPVRKMLGLIGEDEDRHQELLEELVSRFLALK